MAKPNPVVAAPKYEQHPLALKLVPGTMPEEEFVAFCEDLKKRGQQHPIILFENKVLDGWHRYTGCNKMGLTPKFEEYKGDDAAGLVIALNVLRRKLGTTQRALAAAQLNLDYGLSQDEASRRVGVAKLHVNLVVQTLKSGNARVIKMLERPDLTREALYEEMVESDIISGKTRPAPGPQHVSADGATAGLDAFFKGQPIVDDLDEDLIGDGASDDLDGILGDAPSAGGKVLPGGKRPVELSEGGNPTVGSKPSHPERRNKETPASVVAEKFRGLTEADQISFMQITWHIQRKLLVAAGVNTAPLVSKAGAAAETDKIVNRAKAAAAQVGAMAATAAAKASAKAGKGTTPAKASAKASAKG